MDPFDDLQIEESSYFDFVEELNEGDFYDDELMEDRQFNSFLSNNFDF